MIVSLLLCGVLATSQSAVMHQSSNGHFQLELVSANPPVATTAKLQSKAQEKPFVFDVTCSLPASEAATCAKMKVTLERVGERIAKQLLIDVSIQVKANITSTLGGSAGDSTWFGRDAGTDLEFMYPQALFKQLYNGPINASRNGRGDINLVFDTQTSYYFKEDGGPIGVKTDFELVAAHEITIALGIATHWEELGTSNTVKLLQPGIGYDSQDRKALWMADHISSRYMQGSGIQMHDLAKTIQTFDIAAHDISAPGNETVFATSGKPYEAAKTAYQIATSGNLMFGNTIKLNSKPSFSPDFVLLAEEYATTPDFLMTYTYKQISGKTLDEVMKAVGASDLYGPATLEMLNLIGWPTPANPTKRQLEKVSVNSKTVDPSAPIATPTGSAVSFYFGPTILVCLMSMLLAI